MYDFSGVKEFAKCLNILGWYFYLTEHDLLPEEAKPKIGDLKKQLAQIEDLRNQFLHSGIPQLTCF